MIFDFVIFFKFFFAYISNFPLMIWFTFFNFWWYHFFFFFFFHILLFLLHFILNLYETLLYNLTKPFFTSTTTKLIYCCIKQTMCKQWITRRCMFIYFIVDDFLRLLWQVLTFSSKDSMSTYIINWTFIDFSPCWYFNILLSSLGISIKQ